MAIQESLGNDGRQNRHRHCSPTVDHCMMDRLIVMDDGRIIEQNYRTAGQKRHLCAGLWHHQSGGFLGEDYGIAEAMGSGLSIKHP